MKYITIKEASELWNISERRIRQLIQDERIEGAIKVGTTWSIPKDVSKPIDKRVKLEENDFIIDISENFFDEIDRKKKVLDSKRPLPRETVNSLRENYILDWTYNSNAIEGNTLTLIETKVVLEGITIGGKSMREHLEVINHKEAIEYVEELVKQKKEISEFDIRSIHGLVLKGIDDDIAGVYRTGQFVISGATHIPPAGMLVNEKMEQLIIRYNEWCEKYHPLIVATLLHGEFVKIHPFGDGNRKNIKINYEL
ncbi:MAG: Fic family protein [Oscillospiraceae bacterium]|nr:Fic family protein [Oscillospiraceae bacterium]